MGSLILFIMALVTLTAIIAEARRVVCYYNSQSAYRPGAGKFEIEDINPSLCTHAVYTFVGLDGSDVKVLDPWQDLPDNNGSNGFKRFNDLRSQNPKLKTLISMGGLNEGSSKYSAMASDPSARPRFVNNVVTFVKNHGFDGFDLVISWPLPGQLGGSPLDFKTYVSLIKELKETLEPQGLLLSAAVTAPESTASIPYDISQISNYLDFVNLMTYDFHGAWLSQTCLNWPLYYASKCTEEYNVDDAVSYWLENGADPEKLNIGIFFYGTSFALDDPVQNNIGAPSRGPGTAGPYTGVPGMLGYNEICELQKNETWTTRFNGKGLAPYTFYRDQWVAYDNIPSISSKANYIRRKKLGGAMVWHIDTDNFRGNCGRTYPLLTILGHLLN